MPCSGSVEHPEFFALATPNGFGVTLTNVGAAVAAIVLPDGQNRVLGYPTASDYCDDPFFMGVTIGRYANRIRDGRFTLDSLAVHVETDPVTGHCLHGGPRGFHRQIWETDSDLRQSIMFRYRSPSGDQGFPGELATEVRYTVMAPMTLAVDYSAISDADTVVSLTNHCYFNLHGADSDVDGHLLALNADRYLATTAELIPTGEFHAVNATPFDFRRPRELCGADRIDLCFAINGEAGELREAARLVSLQTGIELVVRTTQPALQLYTGDYLDAPFRPRAGLCLEAQHYPDAPNCPQFPSARLAAGDIYRQRIVYEFRECPKGPGP